MDNAKQQVTLADELTNVIDGLHNLFDEIGLARYEREDREANVYAALNAALHDQLRLVAEEKDQLVNQCRDIISQICQMERSLADEDHEIDERRFRISAPLMQCLKDLKEKHSVVKRRHAERYESIKKLVKALETYASRLEPSFIQIALPPITDDSSSIGSFDLSHSYSAQLDEEFNRVYNEYMKRLSIVQTTAKEIINLYSELGIPAAQIDRGIVEYGSNNPEKLGLERSDIDRLKEKKQKLIDERERRRSRVESLKEEIGELWAKLQVDESIQRRLLAQNRGYDLKCIRNLEDELDRLHELKRENLNVFVEDCRAVIRDLWDQLYYSESERSEFTAINSSVYTDALLQNHEMYISQLQDTLRERAPILELINKHKDLLNDKEELAISSQDSSRLLGRGRHDPTRLLREERMRKRIAKELPKVELELKKMLEEWDEEYGCPFTVNGDDYLETLKLLSPVVQSRTNSVKSSSMNNLRGRSNTVSGSSTSARQRSKSRAAAKEPQRSKTPTPRPRTPANGQLFHSGSSTVGRNTGRQITSAASHYSSASSNGTGTLSRQGSAVRPKTPGFAPPRPSAPVTSPTRNARPQLSSYATAPASGGGTIGRNNSSIKRKVANPSLGTAPRMQALRPATRQEDRLTDLLPSRSRHAPIPQFDPPSYPSRQHGSVRSIRSISPAESANYEVYPGSDEEDENTSHSFQDNTPRAAAYPSGRTSQLRVTGPRHDRSSIQSLQSVNSVSSVRSVQSAQSIISVVPRGGQDDTPLDPRKYSSGTDSTSSTLTRSNSGSENWETFGDDSDVESEDPREAYYQQKAVTGGQKGGYGNIGHGHPGTVRQSADRDAWMNDDQGY